MGKGIRRCKFYGDNILLIFFQKKLKEKEEKQIDKKTILKDKGRCLKEICGQGQVNFIELTAKA